MIDLRRRLRRALTASIATALMMLVAVPASADNVNIPEGGAVSPGSTFVINFQVQEGCDGLPTDTLEVLIPDTVVGPLAEDVPGWEIELETGSDGDIEVVRWTGGAIADRAFLEFGLRVGFPDDPGAVIEFPVIQRCGSISETSSPVVALATRFGPRDIIELSESVEALRSTVEEMQQTDAAQANRDDRLGENIRELRERVDDVEAALEEVASADG